MEWIEHQPVLEHVRINYPRPTGEHPLTFTSARERYRDSIADSRLVVWCDRTLGFAGVRAGIDEVAWALFPWDRFELEVTRPARGAGSLFLSHIPHNGLPLWIAQADRFDQRHYAWFKELLRALHAATVVVVAEIDLGVDA